MARLCEKYAWPTKLLQVVILRPPIVLSCNLQGDLLRVELRSLVDPAHALVKLADTVAWARLEELFGVLVCEDHGRPAHPTRLLVALHYLKYSYALSAADVVAGWVENPYWRYLSGMQFFEHRRPLEPSVSLCCAGAMT